jgi:hypothetical protein
MITLFVADDVVAVVIAVVSDRRQSGAIDLGNRIAKRLGMRDVFEGLSIVHLIIVATTEFTHSTTVIRND